MLSARQLSLINYMVNNPQKTNKECYMDLKIPESTFFKWRKNTEFKEELSRQVKEVWTDSERMAVNEMIRLAKEGNFQAVKYILDSLEYQPKQKVALDANTTITVSVGQEDVVE